MPHELELVLEAKGAEYKRGLHGHAYAAAHIAQFLEPILKSSWIGVKGLDSKINDPNRILQRWTGDDMKPETKTPKPPPALPMHLNDKALKSLIKYHEVNKRPGEVIISLPGGGTIAAKAQIELIAAGKLDSEIEQWRLEQA